MEAGFVSIGTISMYYREMGRGSPLVYVHGNTASSLWYELVMDVPGYRVFAPDMPNFGRSSPLLEEITIAHYAESVAGFMDAKGIKDAVIVGHSLGGCVAQMLALNRHDLAKALILIDSGSPMGLVTPKDRHPLIELMRTNRAVLEQALRAVVPGLKDEAFFQKLVDDAQQMATSAWIGNAEALSHFDISSKCAEYQGRVLVIRGSLDALITDEMAKQTTEAFPNASLVTLEDIGHSVIVEDPMLFLKLLREFLAEEREPLWQK
ncbi:MAG: Tropinesterase [Spirochaetes bacterium ADurb.Bin110]|nr:MAG: Tropinesterase [Spirochaetes bacterium ADurb.Bin110]